MKTSLLFAYAIILSTLLQAQVIVTQVKDINPGSTNSSYPNSFVVSGGKLFFIAQSGNNNWLAVTQGTAATTTLLAPIGYINFATSVPVVLQNKVYFTRNDTVHGLELWVSDGTVAGTQLFADLYPGATGSYPLHLTVVNNKLFFLADNPNGARRLYVSDGTAAGTVVVRDAYNVGSANNGPQALGFITLNNTILFQTPHPEEDISIPPTDLWASDGTPAGTQLLVRGASTDTLGGSITLNNKVYFCGRDATHGYELWASNGTPTGTYMLKNIQADPVNALFPNNGYPQGFCLYNGKVYFSADDGIHGTELWATDGTEANTYIVSDAFPGPPGIIPSDLTVFNNKLYFISEESVQQQLWVSDGTDAGTVLVTNLKNDENHFAAIWNNLMYLVSVNYVQMFQTDGTAAGTDTARASNTASPLLSLGGFGEYNGDLYFSGNVQGLTNGFELVKLTNGVLPLTLLSFTGQVQKDNDMLAWQTASEINTAYFEVQQGQANGSFTPVATVAAAGNSSEVQNYSYQQKSVLNPTGYYRLKMADKNGTFNYSRTIRLPRTNAAGVTAFYNNASRQITIQNNTGGVCTWQLFSTAGSLVKKGASADGVINIPAGNIAGGIYVLSCTSSVGASRFTLPVF